MKRYVRSNVNSSDSHWNKIQRTIQEDADMGSNPISEMTDEGMYIDDLCAEVASKLGVMVDSNARNGVGDYYFCDSDGVILTEIDVEAFEDMLLSYVLESPTEELFKSRYKHFLEQLRN